MPPALSQDRFLVPDLGWIHQGIQICLFFFNPRRHEIEYMTTGISDSGEQILVDARGKLLWNSLIGSPPTLIAVLQY